MWPSFNPCTVANWIFVPHLSLVFEACGYFYFIILLSSVISSLVWNNLDPKSSKCLNMPQNRLSDLSLIKNSDTFHPSYFIRLMFLRQDLDRWGLKTHENHWQITRVWIFLHPSWKHGIQINSLLWFHRSYTSSNQHFVQSASGS